MAAFNWGSNTANKENSNSWFPFNPFQTYGKPQLNNDSRQEKHSKCNGRTASSAATKTNNNFPEPQFYKARGFNVCKPQIASSPCLKTIKEDPIFPGTEEEKSREPFEELPRICIKYNDNKARQSIFTARDTIDGSGFTCSASTEVDLKHIPSNKAMSLWTIDELKAYLNRNDFRIPFEHRKGRWYYYRLAVLHQKMKQNRRLEQKVSSLTKCIEAKDCEIRRSNSQSNGINEKCQSLQNENNSGNHMNELQFRKLTQLQEEIRHLQQENQALRRENASYSNTVNEQQHKLKQIQSEHNEINDERQRFQNEATHHKQQMSELQEQCTWFQQRDRKHEEVRKKMHNKIQALKGNIRVFCRIRPLFKKQDAIFKIANEIETDSITLLGPCTKNTISGKVNQAKRYNFAFDRVFGPSADQQTVFREISELVQSALDGYKVCIFAYGQTGSGKTFTMNGASLNSHDANRGMIPRSMEQIFEYKQKLQEKGWEYKCTVSYLEIYNETIRDLLVENKNNNNNSFHSYQIRQKRARNGSPEIYVDGLKEIEVSTSWDVYSLLNLAAKNRSVGRTDCNERSSRSHTVFQLFLKGQNAVSGQKTVGVLNLIDLAGSERLKKSNATGIQLKETQNINKSLSCLGDVIAALASKKNGHIPYRNSKLTYLLMNYFGGEAKTLMVVNLCPETDKTHESLCSLRFAAKVNDCELGSAKRTIYKGGAY